MIKNWLFLPLSHSNFIYKNGSKKLIFTYYYDFIGEYIASKKITIQDMDGYRENDTECIWIITDDVTNNVIQIKYDRVTNSLISDRKINANERIISVTCCDERTYFIDNHGKSHCINQNYWDMNYYRNVKHKIKKIIPMINKEHIIFLTNDNKLYKIKYTHNYIPREMKSCENLNIKDINSGYKFITILTQEGYVYFVGSTSDGWGNKLFNIKDNKIKKLIKIPNLPKIKAISCGNYHCAFITENNHALIYGSNSSIKEIKNVAHIQSYKIFTFVIDKQGYISKYDSSQLNKTAETFPEHQYFHNQIPTLLYLIALYIKCELENYQQKMSISDLLLTKKLPRDIKKLLNVDFGYNKRIFILPLSINQE